MQQFRGARVYVAVSGTVVRQVWQANGSIATGSFSVGDTITWPDNGINESGTGSGVVVGEIGSRIDFYRTSGSEPIAGNTLTGPSGTFSVSGFPRENLTATSPRASYPARFSDSPTQGAITSGDEFYIKDNAVAVVGSIGAQHRDYFPISTWGGGEQTNVECVINRERTSVQGWPLPTQGGRLMFTILKDAIRQIDAWSATVGSGTPGGGPPPTTYSNFSMVNNWVNVAGRATAAWSYEAANETVRLKGYVNRNSGTATTGEDIVAAGGLPTNRRPAERLDFTYEGERFAVHTDGSIKWHGTTGSTPGPVSLNSVSFRANII